MLTRQVIASGAYSEKFASLAGVWTLDEIDASLERTLRDSPAASGEKIWLFAYGSLLWNPVADFDSRCLARLDGWHRSFCLRITVGRASEQCPGRMLALEAGGSTLGAVLGISQARAKAELRLVWIREMILGLYKPIWVSVSLEDGTTAPAIAFVADTLCDEYEAESSIATIMPLVASASGAFGTNAEYSLRLQTVLGEHNLKDSYVDDLISELQRSGTVTDARS